MRLFQTFHTTLIISIFLLLTGTLHAAPTGSVKGKILNKKTNAPVDFVNISINKAGDKTFVTGTISDQEGYFMVDNLPVGKYIATVSFVGFKTSEVPFEIKNSGQEVNLGRIFLEENSEMLDAVHVTSTTTQMQFEVDKKVFNVDQNISSTGGSASDILDNIPSVEVDNEGEISLRGSTDVTIWINGKASGLTSDNRAAILEQLPAETIEKIEVITNPSAKYSPEGTTGIINIVLKKNRALGYYGSVQAGVNTHGGYNASANVNLNAGKFDTYIGFGYRRRAHVGGNTSLRTNSDGTYLNRYGASRNTGNNFFGRGGVTYHATDKDDIYLSAFGMFGNNSSLDTSYYLTDAMAYSTSHRESRSSSKDMGGNVELGYKHEFGKNHNIDISASYNNWNMNNVRRYYEDYYFDDSIASTFQRQESHISPNHWNFQADYTNAFNDNFRLEAGYKGTIEREDSPVKVYAGANEEEAVIAEKLWNEFIYNRDIHALYATFTGKINNFGFQVGLRGENTKVSTKSLAYGQSADDVEPYNTSSFDLFPSAFLSYQLPNQNEVQLNYTRRISRPFGGQLNSFVDISDPLNISYGNPDLEPSYSNSFELNYMKNWLSHMLSVSAYYRTTDGVRERIKFLDGNVMNSTWENVAHDRSAGTEIVVKNSFSRVFDITTTVNLFYYELDSFNYYIPKIDQYVTGDAESDFSWNIRMIANLNIPKIVSVQLTGRYNAKRVVAQGYRAPGYSIDLGVRKTVGKFSFALTGRDILNSRKFHTVTEGTGFIQDNTGWRGGWMVGLTVTYGFGNMNMKGNRNNRDNPENMQNGYEDSSTMED